MKALDALKKSKELRKKSADLGFKGIMRLIQDHWSAGNHTDFIIIKKPTTISDPTRQKLIDEGYNLSPAGTGTRENWTHLGVKVSWEEK